MLLKVRSRALPSNIIPFALSSVMPRAQGRAGESVTAVRLRESTFGLSLSKGVS